MVALLRGDAGDELGDGGRLVAFRLVIRHELERAPAFRLFRPRRAMRRPRRLRAQVGVARLQQRLQRFDGRRGADQLEAAARALARPDVEAALRRLGEAVLGTLLVQRRVEESGEMLVERFDVGARRLGASGTGGAGRGRHSLNMGPRARRGKRDAASASRKQPIKRASGGADHRRREPIRLMMAHRAKRGGP